MTLLLINLFVLVLLSGAAKAKADRVGHQKDEASSWMNKWAHMDVVDRRLRSLWYMGMYTPKYQEKFPYSSTFLVWLTDRWHTYNFIQYRLTDMALSLAVVHCHGAVGFWISLAAPIARGIGFTLFYDRD